jgi:hypothetical protein
MIDGFIEVIGAIVAVALILIFEELREIKSLMKKKQA